MNRGFSHRPLFGLEAVPGTSLEAAALAGDASRVMPQAGTRAADGLEAAGPARVIAVDEIKGVEHLKSMRYITAM